MLQHIADTLPPTLHLPISPVDTLHFYRYLHTLVLIENKQFLLLIDIPIQDRGPSDHDTPGLFLGYPTWKLFSLLWYQHKILWSHQGCHNGIGTFHHTIWSMPTGKWTILPHFYDFPASGKSTNMHCGLYAKSEASIKLRCSLQLHKASITSLPTQDHSQCLDTCCPNFSSYRHHKAWYAQRKPLETIPIRQPLHILKLPMACSATSSHFYLPPRYESPVLNINCIIGYGKPSNC